MKVGSPKVTPAQRSSLNPQTKNGAWAATWAQGRPVAVSNAHDQQAAPAVALKAPVVSNRE